MRGNTITMQLAAGTIASSEVSLYQYDYGQRLILTGVELPASYEVHFGNKENGESYTMIGDETGVDIPDECLMTWGNIHVWVYLHTGEADGETEFHGIIGVTKRAKPTDEVPTPAQQSVIDQTIAALNAGISTVEGIAESIPQTVDAALEEAKASGEFDGFSPSATVSKSGEVSTISITDKDGTTTTEVNDGYSPTAFVNKSGSKTTITIIDKNGTTSAQVRDGKDGDPGTDGVTPLFSIGTVSTLAPGSSATADMDVTNPERPVLSLGIPQGIAGPTGATGDDGFSPTASVSKSDGVATITITDKSGTTTATISDVENVIDDTAGDGDTDKTWSADKLVDEFAGKLDASEKGVAGGVAELDNTGKVPSSQLPSYVDDVLEYSSQSAFPSTGETGKIYIAQDTNKTYRWSGSAYAEISESLALGETSATAYRGDRGAEAYAAAVTNVETTPTDDSSNLITSGAVYSGLSDKYEKPSGGIPSTDLASGVQTSLGLADTAYQKPSGGIPSTDLASGVIPTVPVQDVQVNGTSVLNQGVANVPVASDSAFGAVKVGTGLKIVATDNTLRPNTATVAQAKAGTASYYPITPLVQDASTFYGLAKASGDTSQASSSNAVGTYTDTAKEKIQGMLDVPSQEAIADKESATATAAHAIGKLFLMGGKLYKATAAISIGDTIVTSGTGANAEQTNVAEEASDLNQAINQKQDAPASGSAAGKVLGLTEVSNELVPTWVNQPSVPVQDVQVNGVSVLNQGVANVPLAASGVLGVVKTASDSGILIDANGNVKTNPPGDTVIKTGTEGRRPIVPYSQHVSTFYGLAKAAGADMASLSSVTVGQYPDAQKSAISTMLNGAVSVSGTTPSITGLAGLRYVCGECATLSIVAPASGCIDVTFTSGSTPTVLTVTTAKTGATLKWANGFDPTSLEANTVYEINILDGEFGVVGKWT